MSLRKRLYKRSRPIFRQVAEEDIALLAFAWMRGAFSQLNGATKEQFVIAIRAILSRYTEVFIAEDKTSVFSEGRGPIGIVGINSDGWKATITTEPFPWITPLQRLSSMVSFFHMMRYSKTYGVVIVVSDEGSFYDRVGKYTSLRKSGIIPFGTPDGPELIYSMRTARDGKERIDGAYHRDSRAA